MKPFSKTAAIREARRLVKLHRSGTGWVVIGPYQAHDPHGPSTERQHPDYWSARQRVREWRAMQALALMGRLTDETHWACHDSRPGESLDDIVRDCLAVEAEYWYNRTPKSEILQWVAENAPKIPMEESDGTLHRDWAERAMAARRGFDFARAGL